MRRLGQGIHYILIRFCDFYSIIVISIVVYMVTILDGNSEIGAQLKKRINSVILSVQGIWLDRQQSQFFFFNEYLFSF